MKAEIATTATAAITAVMATARSLEDDDLGFWVCGIVRDEMLAGNEAKEEGEGGGGVEGYVGKKGGVEEEDEVLGGVVENGYFGFGDGGGDEGGDGEGGDEGERLLFCGKG